MGISFCYLLHEWYINKKHYFHGDLMSGMNLDYYISFAFYIYRTVVLKIQEGFIFQFPFLTKNYSHLHKCSSLSPDFISYNWEWINIWIWKFLWEEHGTRCKPSLLVEGYSVWRITFSLYNLVSSLLKSTNYCSKHVKQSLYRTLFYCQNN